MRKRDVVLLRPVMISMMSSIVLGARMMEDVLSIRTNHLVPDRALEIIVDSATEEEAVDDGSRTASNKVVLDIPLAEVLEMAPHVGSQVLRDILEPGVQKVSRIRSSCHLLGRKKKECTEKKKRVSFSSVFLLF